MTKIKWWLIFTILIFLWLELRLFWLTGVKGKEYYHTSQNNRIKVVYEAALRGIIEDNQGKVIVRNTPDGRKYVYGQQLAHMTGYLGEAETDEIQANDNLTMGDWVGKSGIEKQYDTLLRGQKGERLVEVDSNGKIIREMGHKDSITGINLKLFVDLNLQQKAYAALGEKTGAVIVSRPNGEILALVVKPSFDPNLFINQTNEADQEKLVKLLTDERQPIFNRAVAGLYPPGSIFKVIVAIAGLENNKITPETEFEDTGKLCIGVWCFGNWYYSQYGRTEGMVDLVKALRRSNDIYFYQVGQLVGIKGMSDWAHHFGLTQPTGIDLPGEESGFFPSPEWKQAVKGESWYLGDTIISSIGQGDILTTPIQINRVTAALAHHGQLCIPRLLAAKQDLLVSEEWKEIGPSACQDLGISELTRQTVLQGMKAACAPGGTGWPFFNFGTGGESTASANFKRIEVGCKTGTAEFGDPTDQTHAWFTVFAPWEQPEIVVTVLAEKAGEGSYEAAPVAKEIMRYYFEKIAS